MGKISAADLEIISGLFLSAAEQMRRTLVRTAFNAVIYEVLDFGISIADSKGRMVAEAAGITSFIGANDYALKMLLQKLDLSSLRPGDVVMLNYPYWNSAHASDALLMSPVFIDNNEIDMFLCAIYGLLCFAVWKSKMRGILGCVKVEGTSLGES